ncbi:hypothetical protein CO112_02405 [Candidatus Dojkabacteria bacterium CG_4_9_14_3_um_filter_150_Dojkabacteria_WS6_41_13]|nr:MAG: hypothetical protein COZ14_03580 [Candidatus Dojkabacteria bacterium CG_4_10_14_3_um_filter_Dojkabacteria_WS6_41_9]PJB22801.1 MAG: hypothetical protein CO112_02405 [Candidatus Dojkabacteria bacterium CG_4_9_14_3_um_filter_150_Dojkabacteria_WS6_41_13]
MIKTLFSNLPVILVAGITTLSSGAAVSKLAATYWPALANSQSVVGQIKRISMKMNMPRNTRTSKKMITITAMIKTLKTLVVTITRPVVAKTTISVDATS